MNPMKNNNVNVLHILSFLIIILSVVATATGLFYTTGGAPFDIINQYGDSVKMYGDGIYARDSFFRVPIFKGTDLTILLVGVPMLAAATLLDLKKEDCEATNPTGIQLFISPAQEGGTGLYASFDFADHMHGHGDNVACPDGVPSCGRNSDSFAGPDHKNRHFCGFSSVRRLFRNPVHEDIAATIRLPEIVVNLCSSYG